MQGEPGLSRADKLARIASQFNWAYVPRFYEPQYREDGTFADIVRLRDVPAAIKPCVIDDLNGTPLPTRPIVPFVETSHDRIAIEIMRGCPWQCRFCQSTTIKRPLRYRTVETIVNAALESYRHTGHDEISLLSLSTSDYPHFELVTRMSENTPLSVKISLPSLRITETSRRSPPCSGRPPGRRRSRPGWPATTCASRSASRSTTRTFMTARPRSVPARLAAGEALFHVRTPRRAAHRPRWDRRHGRDHREDRQGRDRAACRRHRQRLQLRFPGHTRLSVERHADTRISPVGTQVSASRVRDSLGLRQVPDIERSLLEGILTRGDRQVAEPWKKSGGARRRLDAWSEYFNSRLWWSTFQELDRRSLLQPARRPNRSSPALGTIHVKKGRSITTKEQEPLDRATCRDTVTPCLDPDGADRVPKIVPKTKRPPRWPWVLLILAAAWSILIRVPLVFNASIHLDSDLAVDGLTLLEATRGHWRLALSRRTPFIGSAPVAYSIVQALIWGTTPETLVSGGVVAALGVLATTFWLAWQTFGPRVAALSLAPLTFASTGTIWLSGRITGGHLTAAACHAGAFALLAGCLGRERNGLRIAALGFWCGLSLVLDSMAAVTVMGVIAAALGFWIFQEPRA